jgi:hypothetical protein
MHSKEQVQQIAELLMPGFIPKDKTANDFSFNFTVPPDDTFRVWFEKNKDLSWKFIKYEAVER